MLQKLLHDQCAAWVGIEAGSCLLLLLYHIIWLKLLLLNCQQLL